MKKLVAGIFALVMSASLFVAPSHAADDWPAAPTPNWLAQSGINGLRVGQWIPCKSDWNSTNDCIQSLKWSKLDGSKSGFATFNPNPAFDPMSAVQRWEGATSPQGDRVDNYAHFVDIQYGTWTLPDGFTNSDGSKTIYVEAHFMAGGLQFRVITNNDSNLPSDSAAQIVLKSNNYGKYIGWIFGNMKDPQVSIAEGVVTITGNPVVTPYAAGPDPDICHSNIKKAAGSNSVIQITLALKNPNEVINAGDAILGTNGNGCFTGVYFDKNSQQIVVGIGNAHFDEFGNPIQGWFNLRVKGSWARKWWGIDPASAANSVQVQVIYEDGSTILASTVAKYDSVLDVISLVSQGFHYSSPTLRVGIKKASPAKTTITCIKGKTSRTVTAVKPTCPSGYKRK
jgi:hypothetical protein